MDRKLIDAICRDVSKKFPEMSNSRPVISDRPEGQVLMVFKGTAQTADGHSIARTVRVVADQAGKIIKLTTSR